MAMARMQARACAIGMTVAALIPCVSSELRDLVGQEVASPLEFRLAGLTPLTSSTRTVRTVNPSFDRISGWISSVGAAAAVGDLDLDGYSDDICIVDPRTDEVCITHAPLEANQSASDNKLYRSFMIRQPVDQAHGTYFDPLTMAPMGTLILDVNQDGWPDVVTYYWGRTPIAFLRDPTKQIAHDAAWVPALCVRESDRWYTNAATVADMNGDGRLDLVVGNYFEDGSRVLDPCSAGEQPLPTSMSRAYNGGGVRILLRTDRQVVPFEAGPPVGAPETATSWVLAVAASDLDGDLFPELFIANDFGPDHLFHNRTQADQKGREADCGPFANPTLVEVKQTSRGLLTPRSHILGADSFKGMGVEFADIDDDGCSDILVSNITQPFGLQESNLAFESGSTSRETFAARLAAGESPFIETSEALGLARTGWAWDIKAADFDNDSTPEVIQALGFLRGETNRWAHLQELASSNDHLLQNPAAWPDFRPGADLSGHCQNPLFWRRSAQECFRNVAATAGLEGDRVTRGIAIADVNRDGLLDFVFANQWSDSEFGENCSRVLKEAAFLGLTLLLPLAPEESFGVTRGAPSHSGVASTPAVGAAAEVRVLRDGQEHLFRAVVDGGNGHSGKRAPELHFGLGTGATILSVALHWRDRSGMPKTRSIQVGPGWHTVMLGSGGAQ